MDAVNAQGRVDGVADEVAMLEELDRVSMRSCTPPQRADAVRGWLN